MKSLFILGTIKAEACKIAKDTNNTHTCMHNTIRIGLLEYKYNYHWTV